MSRVVHFEIHASDPEKVQSFYGELFGWRFTPWGPPEQPAAYWLIATGEGPGIDGGLVPRRGEGPPSGAAVNAFVCTVNVESVDGALAKSESLGGTLALPKQAIPGVGWLAYVKDPDGNIVGLMQNDTSAR